MTTTTKRHLPPWAPFAFIAGTSVVLILPLFWLRRQRGHALRAQLTNSNPTTALSAVHFARGLRVATVTTPAPVEPPPSESDSSPPSIFTALSKSDTSTALYAAKALGIATFIVALGGIGLTWTIKTATGIENMHDFAHRARQGVHTYIPSLAKNLYKLPEPLDELVSDPELEKIILELDNELIQENKRRNVQ